MNRRHVLSVSGVGLAVFLGGCQQLASTPGPPQTDGEPNAGCVGSDCGPPEYGCDNADRPSPPPYAGESISRARYPPRPESLSDAERIVGYVEKYERAYRRNDLLVDYGADLEQFDMSAPLGRIYDAPDGAAVVRLEYSFSFKARRGGATVHGDSLLNYATYYVDDEVLIRASSRRDVADASAPAPDPWDTGTPVECFR